MSALEKLGELAGIHASTAARAHVERGGRAVGFLCSHVPEEVLHAAGLLPVRLRAPGCAQTASADTYLSHLNCSYVRACLEHLLTSRLGFLDGLILTNGCDHTRRLYDILRETRDYDLIHVLAVPRKAGGDPATTWFRDEIARLKQAVEQAFGASVTDDDLRSSIDTYNETKRLLARLYDLRKSDAPPISGAEAMAVFVAGWSLERSGYNQLLGELLDELETRGPVSGHRARLMIAGSGGCDDPAWIEVIEDLGGLVVTDSLCFGSRSFVQLTESDDDPLLGLAGSYLRRPSCAGMADEVAKRSTYIVEMAREFRVDGVVFQRIRYCDLWGGQLLHLGEVLKEAGIPMLSLEREYALSGVGQLKTRVQAFLERLER